MSKTILILTVLLISTVATAAPPATPGVVGGGVTIRTVPTALKTFVAPVVRPKQAKELQQLVRAVQAIEDKGVSMTANRRLRIAKAALRASRATGVDATLLIAIARMESDFRGLQVIGWRCRRRGYRSCAADCGITQHYISGPPRYVLRRCRQLARDYGESFLKSAKEIKHHIQFCQKRAKRNRPLTRCVLNRYNSGTFYRTARLCDRRHQYCTKWCPKVDWTAAKPARAHRYQQRQRCRNRCYRAKRKCRHRAKYWVKVLCFDFGARMAVRSRRSCRRAYSLKDIPVRHYRASVSKSPAKTATVPVSRRAPR